MIDEAGKVRLARKGNIDSFIPLIAKLAIATYHKLPSSQKMGTSWQDLAQEGQIVATTKAAKMWKPGRNVKFITYLHVALENHFKGVLKAAYTQQRVGSIYSIDSTYRVTNSVSGLNAEKLSNFLVRRSRLDKLEDQIIARIDAERAFIKAYALASPQLRLYLIRWILTPNPNGTFKDGDEARDSRVEFRITSVKHLNYKICQTIQSDFDCRFNIANYIALNFKTMRPRSMKKTYERPLIYLTSVERELTPILSKRRQQAIQVFEKMRLDAKQTSATA